MQTNSNSQTKFYKAMDSWLNASSIILTTPKFKNSYIKKTETDFNVMMLKRSAKSSFYANAYVFPGGKIDKADYSKKWINLFDSVDKSFVKYFQKLKINQIDKRRSPMFLSKSNNSLLKEVSYRICAIRETFEETGVLLTRMNPDGLDKSVRYANFHEFKNIAEVTEWRKRVHEDATQFVELCAKLSCVPDVWALHEWCNWLTPSEMISKYSKRYDTVFYKAALNTVPDHFQHDDKEITHIILNTPDEILSAYYSSKITCGPPQVYELSRILQFNKHCDLIKFSCQRGLLGMERWLPVLACTNDECMLSLYPGDHFYPDEEVLNGNSSAITLSFNYEQILKSFPRELNHMKILTLNQNIIFDVVSTCLQRYGHLTPSSFRDFLNKFPRHKL